MYSYITEHNKYMYWMQRLVIFPLIDHKGVPDADHSWYQVPGGAPHAADGGEADQAAADPGGRPHLSHRQEVVFQDILYDVLIRHALYCALMYSYSIVAFHIVYLSSYIFLRSFIVPVPCKLPVAMLWTIWGQKGLGPLKNPSKCPVICVALGKKNNHFLNQKYIGFLMSHTHM
jgi:hypothetical protein